MKNKNTLCGVLVAVIALPLVMCLLPPLPRSKAGSSHIQTAVNRKEGVSVIMPGTNGLPAATMSK